MKLLLKFFLSCTAYSIYATPGLNLTTDPFTYSSAYTDLESGQQYLNARYYNPRLMRFATRDSYTLMDRYGYGNANPIMNDDPSGHISMSWQAGVGMGIGGLSGVIAGFFTGGVGSFVAVAITEAVIGGASSAISDGVTYALGGKMTWKQAGLDVGLGGAMGLLGSALGAGVGKVMGRASDVAGVLDDVDNAFGAQFNSWWYGSKDISSLISYNGADVSNDKFSTLVSKINPSKATNNCGACAAAFDRSVATKTLYTAKNTGNMPIDDLAYMTKKANGVPLSPLASRGSFSRSDMNKILARLSEARGFIAGYPKNGIFTATGHVVNFIKDNAGMLTIIDAQRAITSNDLTNIFAAKFTEFRYFTVMRQ